MTSGKMTERFNTIHKLLLERNLTIISDINNELRCSICSNILINARQTVSGCNFCERCITKYVNDGSKCCPGKTKKCKMDKLSNIITNHKKNQEISRLRVRCDEEGCGYECELIELETHLKNCGGKKFDRSISNIEGEEDKLCYDRRNEHSQMECYNRNNSLMEIMNELRKEMKEMKKNEEKNKYEILMLKEVREKDLNEIKLLKENITMIKKEAERLKDNLKEITVLKETLKAKDEIIVSKNSEIVFLKQQKKTTPEDMSNQKCKGNQNDQGKESIERINSRINNLEKYLQMECHNRNTSLIEVINDMRDEMEKLKEKEGKNKRMTLMLKEDREEDQNEITMLKEDINSIKKETEKLQNNFISKETVKVEDAQIDSINSEIVCSKQQKQMSPNEINKEKNEKNQNVSDKESIEEIISRIDNLEKYLDLKDGVFVWNIGAVDNLSAYEYSSPFYLRNEFYKMRLELTDLEKKYRSFGRELPRNYGSLVVSFVICPGELDMHLQWPFRANVSIQIFDSVAKTKTKLITKFCVIPIPQIYKVNEFQMNDSWDYHQLINYETNEHEFMDLWDNRAPLTRQEREFMLFCEPQNNTFEFFKHEMSMAPRKTHFSHYSIQCRVEMIN